MLKSPHEYFSFVVCRNARSIGVFLTSGNPFPEGRWHDKEHMCSQLLILPNHMVDPTEGPEVLWQSIGKREVLQIRGTKALKVFVYDLSLEIDGSLNYI